MTFEALDERYPNGFVDAEISSLNIDYQSRTASVRLNMRGNPPDGPNSQEYSRAVLTVHEFFYFSMEPPDFDHQVYSKRGIQVDGFPEDPRQFALFERLKPTLPAGAFCCRFFVHDWNSFIHIAAENAELSWADSSS